jgi:hypothetical protein
VPGSTTRLYQMSDTQVVYLEPGDVWYVSIDGNIVLKKVIVTDETQYTVELENWVDPSTFSFHTRYRYKRDTVEFVEYVGKSQS